MKKMEDYLDAFIRPDLIAVEMAADDKEQAIRQLTSMLEAQGYVKETFIDAILEREKVFPTGLPTEDIQVALPHTDVEHCLKPGMAIGTLKKPVEFIEMGTLDRIVNVSMIFVLTITIPHDQVVWLARLATLFQKPGFLMYLKQLGDAQLFSNQLIEALRMEKE